MTIRLTSVGEVWKRRVSTVAAVGQPCPERGFPIVVEHRRAYVPQHRADRTHGRGRGLHALTRHSQAGRIPIGKGATSALWGSSSCSAFVEERLPHKDT